MIRAIHKKRAGRAIFGILYACVLVLFSLSPLWAQGKKSLLKIFSAGEPAAVYTLELSGKFVSTPAGKISSKTLRVPSFSASADIQRAVSSAVLQQSAPLLWWKREPVLNVKQNISGVTEINYRNVSVLASGSRAFYRTAVLIKKHKKLSSWEEVLAWIRKNPSAAAQEYGLPQFKNKAYIISDLSQVVPDPKARKTYPAPRYAFDLVRGMNLDPKSSDLHLVFQTGLDIRKTYAEEVYMTPFPDAESIYMTPFPETACLAAYAGEGLPLVFHISWEVKGDEICLLSLMPPVIKSKRSIAAEEIMQVSAFLKINGKHQWGQLERLSSGNFLFRPYAPTHGAGMKEEPCQIAPKERIPKRLK